MSVVPAAPFLVDFASKDFPSELAEETPHLDLAADAERDWAERVEEAAMGVRALIDGLFMQWLEESDWSACTAATRRCVRARSSAISACPKHRRPRAKRRRAPGVAP